MDNLGDTGGNFVLRYDRAVRAPAAARVPRWALIAAVLAVLSACVWTAVVVLPEPDLKTKQERMRDAAIEALEMTKP